MTPVPVRHAVVLGGSLAGTLAAAALAPHAHTVTIVDRDRLPDGATARKGTPHARHTHLLLAGGARALDELVPDTVSALRAAGAHRLGMPNEVLSSSPEGWSARFPERQFLISASRSLLDWVVRRRVREHHAVAVREGAEVIGLRGDRARVTGVRIRDRATRTETTLDADLVVDATGGGSRAPDWLAALGADRVREDSIDPGIFYATRLYRPPVGTEHDWPGISIQPGPDTDPPGKGGVLMPIEDNRWLVTVAGMRGAEPPTDPAGFDAYARGLRHPVIADLIATAEPLTAPFGFRGHPNRRRHFHRMNPYPAGFLALGDAYCTFNPIYGHGMSAVVLAASVVRADLGRTRSTVDCRGTQARIARSVDTAWAMAVGQDVRYPHTIGAHPTSGHRWRQRYLDRLGRAARGRPAVAYAWLDVYTLSAGPRRLFTPRMFVDALRGPNTPVILDPPFTADEIVVLPSGCSSGCSSG